MKINTVVWINFGAFKGEEGIVVGEEDGMVTVEVKMRDGSRPKVALLEDWITEPFDKLFTEGVSVLIRDGHWTTGDFNGMVGTIKGLSIPNSSIYDVEVHHGKEDLIIQCFATWLNVVELPNKETQPSEVDSFITIEDPASVEREPEAYSITFELGDHVKMTDGKFKGQSGRITEKLGDVMSKVEINNDDDGPIVISCFNSWLVKLTENDKSLGEALRDLLEPSEKLSVKATGEDLDPYGKMVDYELKEKADQFVKSRAKKPKSDVKPIKQEEPVSYIPQQENHGVELKNIPLRQLVASPTNPRKTFDENDLKELSDSIKEKGVVQPIVVRKSQQFADTYEVVCGERRFRASKLAGIDTIPAVVRVLSDEEALDLQIIENLQRKDVQPMEEAAAFKVLNERNNMTISEMALRVGKSEKYVGGRLKLNDLIPEFQEVLLAGKISLKTAYAACRTSEEVQMDIYDKYVKGRNWRDDKWFNVDDRHFTSEDRRLSSAPFDITDTTLDIKNGSCVSCMYNTANQPVLFDTSEPLCKNSPCYISKVLVNLEKQIDKVTIGIEEPDTVFASDSYYLSDEDKKRIADLPKSGTPFIKRDNYMNSSEGEKGAVRALIVANGSSMDGLGRYIYIKPSVNLTPNESTFDSRKSKITQRETRAKELDNQKVIAKVQELIKELDVSDKEVFNLSYFDKVEMGMVTYFLLTSTGYHSPFENYIKDLFEIKEMYGDNVAKNIVGKFTNENINGASILFNKVLRKFTACLLSNNTYGGDPFKTCTGYLTDRYARIYVGDGYNEIREEQREIAEKRAKRVEQKLKELEDEE